MYRAPIRRPVAAAALALAASCGQWQRVGSDTAPDPNVLVPQLFDAATIYRDMGLLAAGAPLPFVGGVRFLAGPTGDSTLAVFGLSLANRALSFRRAGEVFEGRYRVEVTFRAGGRIVRQVAQDETVRVATFQETQRPDESLIFQRFVTLPPGDLDVTVAVRDRFGSGFSRVTGSVRVPRFGLGPGLSSLVPVYEGGPRTDRTALPDLVVNPRATVPYGADTLRVYLEAYGADARTVVIRLMSEEQEAREIWRDTLIARGDVSGTVVRLSPEQLPVGTVILEAFLTGGRDTVMAPALVSFSDQWVVANFDETLFLLRYFGQDEAVNEMRDATDPARRLELWRQFWEATDPNQRTPENEALDLYFRRLQEANQRFREGSDPGWLTDRGEVYITIGEPDEIFDSSSDLQGRGQRFIRWTYISLRLTLDFVDETGFGRFRLTTASRAAYQEALNRVRRRG